MRLALAAPLILPADIEFESLGNRCLRPGVLVTTQRLFGNLSQPNPADP